MKLTNITNVSCSALENIDGTAHRKAYMNTEQGRTEFIAECADAENYSEVLAVWGETPVVVPSYDPPANTQPTQEERIAQLEAALNAIEEGIASV